MFTLAPWEGIGWFECGECFFVGGVDINSVIGLLRWFVFVYFDGGFKIIFLGIHDLIPPPADNQFALPTNMPQRYLIDNPIMPSLPPPGERLRQMPFHK